MFGVFRAVENGGDIRQANRSAIAISHDDGFIAVAGDELVICTDGVGLMGAIEGAFGLIDVGSAERGAQIFQTESVGSERGGVGLNAHGRTLAATDAHEAHTS